MVAAVVGFVVMLVLNAFVLDEFDAYGEVPIPGTGSVELPAGEVTVSFHTLVTGSNGGLPVPPLQLGVEPPDGAPDPVVTESFGGTTTVNNDARVRVWVVQVAEAGTYGISTDGQVQGYINPRLSFGHGSEYGWLLWLFGGLFALSVLELTASLIWSARVRRRVRPIVPVQPVEIMSSYQPSDQGIRIEQLKTIAALRDSGALTEAEFESEKRRILES
ncbi:SHOCT domain-containing protein [Mycobacterium sp. LTG2003]